MSFNVLLMALLQAASPTSPQPFEAGPRVGELVPPFSLSDQDKTPRDFASLAGPNGLVLLFFRSADW